jgi:hypothetical protein
MTMDIDDPDRKAIEQAASDYCGGWYEANVERISSSLHPDLAKRAIRIDGKGNEYLSHLSKERMLELTREGGGSETPVNKRLWEIVLLDRYEEMATVKAVSTDYIDYLHLARQDGQWLIVNALWTDNRTK